MNNLEINCISKLTNQAIFSKLSTTTTKLDADQLLVDSDAIFKPVEYLGKKQTNNIRTFFYI